MMTIVIFIFGLLIGSFIACMIDRKHRRWAWRETLFKPSRCLTCDKALKPWHNMPVVSYLVQGGRCAYCGARIPRHLPLIEMACGLIAAFIWAWYQNAF